MILRLGLGVGRLFVTKWAGEGVMQPSIYMYLLDSVVGGTGKKSTCQVLEQLYRIIFPDITESIEYNMHAGTTNCMRNYTLLCISPIDRLQIPSKKKFNPRNRKEVERSQSTCI